MFTEALFKENEALAEQWYSLMSSEGLQKREDIVVAGSAARLFKEIAEYLLLSNLAGHLVSYFNDPRFDKGLLVKYSRDDLPDLLLSNRVLELFSRDMADRPGFALRRGGRNNDSWETVTAYSSTGHFYNKFELTLPRGSSVTRASDGVLWIENRSISLGFAVKFRNSNIYVPRDFLLYYLDVDSNEVRQNRQHMEVVIEVTAVVRGRFIAYGKNVSYYEWLDNFLLELRDKTDFRAFLNSLSWSTVAANARVFAASRRNADSE